MKISRCLVVMLAVLAVASSGCIRKKVKDEDMAPSGIGGADLGASSLDRFQQGQDPSEGGPLSDVRFGYDRHDLDSAARNTLERNAEWLRENPGVRVEIEGHCDERGTVEYNLALGARRARTVKDYLAALGIEPERLSTISYGEELPLCQSENESCWSRNRRAHFVVLR